ncbi:MAG: hypothetical protein QM662_10225, partial [Gordonia sp. (in: high G+C Gram-positive bacteria)]
MAAPTTTRHVGVALGWVAAGSMLANLCSYLVHVVASAWFLTPAEYGELAVLGSAMLVLGVPALALQAVVAREVARGTEVSGLRALIVRSTAVVTALTVVAVPVVAVIARTGWMPTAAALATAPPLAVIAAGQGILQGRHSFRALSSILALTGMLRAVPVIVALMVGAGPGGALLAGTIGAVVAAGGASVLAGSSSRRRNQGTPAPAAAAAVPDVLRASQVQLVLIVASSVDLLLARAVLGAADAGVYALGAIATKVAFWLPQAVGVVAYPRLADPVRSRESLRCAIGVVAAIGAVLTVAAGLAGPAVPLVVGADYRPLATILWVFTYTGAALAVLQVLLLAAIAAGTTRMAALTWAGTVIEVVGIIAVARSVPALAATAAVTVTIAVALTLMARWSPRPLSLRLDLPSLRSRMVLASLRVRLDLPSLRSPWSRLP